MIRSFLCILIVALVSLLGGCASCENPYASVPEDHLRTPLGLLKTDRSIPAQDLVFFSRKTDGRVYVISKCTPATHGMLIYVEKSDGLLWEQSRDQDFCINIEPGDRRVIAFTVMDDKVCNDREEAFCEGRLSRDVLDL